MFFAPSFVSSYKILTDSLFETYTGWGKDAKIKSTVEHRPESYTKVWDKDWNDSFTNNDNKKEISNNYMGFITLLRSELGIKEP
jgi:hypothetical protein